MTFSVLQSVYIKDNPIYLDKSLQSLSEQTLLPNEIIIVKDGKLTDELEDVLNFWKTKLPIRIEGYDQNKGLAHALNYGIKFITTDLVARMDSDDYCFPDRFEKQVDFFEDNTKVDICGTGILEFYENGNHKKIQTRLYPCVVTGKSKYLYRGTPLGHPTVMIKTDILKKYLYTETTVLNEDIDLWFRLLCDGYEIYNIQEPLLNFRITDGTFNRRSFAKAKNEYRIYRHYLVKLFGFSISLVLPFMRFLSRFMPKFVLKRLYYSNLRSNILINKKKME